MNIKAIYLAIPCFFKKCATVNTKETCTLKIFDNSYSMHIYFLQVTQKLDDCFAIRISNTTFIKISIMRHSLGPRQSSFYFLLVFLLNFLNPSTVQLHLSLRLMHNWVLLQFDLVHYQVVLQYECLCVSQYVLHSNHSSLYHCPYLHDHTEKKSLL